MTECIEQSIITAIVAVIVTAASTLSSILTVKMMREIHRNGVKSDTEKERT